MRVIKTYTLVLIIFSFSWGQIIDTSPYFISLQGLQEVLSEKEKDLLDLKKDLNISDSEDFKYIDKITDLVLDCNNLSRDISFILFVFEELSYQSKKLAATTLSLKYDLMVLKYDLIKDYLILVKDNQADKIVYTSMKVLNRIFQITEEVKPIIETRIKYLENSYFLSN